MNKSVPSGENVSRLKKDVKVSLAYMLVLLGPVIGSPPEIPGDAAGMTAGKGSEGLGETERRMEEPNEDRLLCEVGGGFIGKANESGVPGAEGAGEPTALSMEGSLARLLPLNSGGAGLFDDIRRLGISILVILLCCAKLNWPSLFLRV